jgi:hypothetical protein
VAQVVRDYIDTHPSVKDCLKYDLLNLSALSRRIMEERGIKNMDAALIACRRYQTSSPSINEEAIRRVLGKSKVEMQSKVAILTLRNDWHIVSRLEKVIRVGLNYGHAPKIVQGSKGITVITEEVALREIEEILGPGNVLRTQDGLVELSVTSPENIRAIPGIMAYLSSALSGNGINIVETMSCYTDTIFILEEKDMVRGFEILSKCIE